MKYEDTVVHADGCSTNLGVIGAVCNCGAKAQAEISFKAGENKGYAHARQHCEDVIIPQVEAEAKQAGKREMIELSDELLEIGRKAIEDALIVWRDGRLSEFNRGNGLVIREKDGKDSSIIRFGPETALKIGMKAIGQALEVLGE